MNDETVRVHWYEHNCEWLTKYCDDHHMVSASVPKAVLRKYAYALPESVSSGSEVLADQPANHSSARSVSTQTEET